MTAQGAIEIERKFIVEKPSEELLSECEGYTKSVITQIYLSSQKNETRRVRKRVYNDRTVYIETKKTRIDPMSSNEIEREITEEEYNRLLLEKREGTAPVNKIRYTVDYHSHTFEIDVYPEWKRSCIMEVELLSRDESVDYPPFIKIVREVTGNKAYSNASMAKAFPSEQ